MKKTKLILLILSILSFASCRKNTDAYLLSVNIQSSFEQDHVKVLLDGQLLINKQLQTNHALGVCVVDGQASSIRSEGDHQLTVIINNNLTKTTTLHIDHDLYIGVNYNRLTNNISIDYSGRAFVYE